jgi:hypothetical protein
MDTVERPSTGQERSELGDGVLPPQSSGNEWVGGDTPDLAGQGYPWQATAWRGRATQGYLGAVTPRPTHPFSGGILLPETCWHCGRTLYEHEEET